MTLSKRIQYLLEKTGKTQADLARYLGTKQSTVSGWINQGRIPSSDVIIPICNFFEVTPNFLFSEPDPYAGLTSNQRELLSLFNQIEDERNQIKALGQIELIIKEFVNEQ